MTIEEAIKGIIGIWLMAQIMVWPLVWDEWKIALKVDIAILAGLLLMVVGLALIGVF